MAKIGNKKLRVENESSLLLRKPVGQIGFNSVGKRLSNLA